MSFTTKVLLYDTLLDMTEKEFISAAHNTDPAFILLYSLPWKDFIDVATCVNCASKSIIMPCKFGMFNLDNNAKIQKRYNITQKNRIMLFKNNRMYFLPMQDLSISAFERFLTVGSKEAVSMSLPTRYNIRSNCKNICADLVGVWCDKVGTFVVVMAFVGIILMALFILLTSNKSNVRVTAG
ncbi:uncharacterized protein LOC134826407 [Bolinopsis microptera]|uniref:uncharacterized protein LOC134826407 n=1 Tax=Bolinopsis microptera TaxID=2820187 RepID=UPI00307ABDB0